MAVAAPRKPAVKSASKPDATKPAAKAGWNTPAKEKRPPPTLPCGCNAIRVRCGQEELLGAEMEAARAAWLASGLKPGDALFGTVYGRLLVAREVYHWHFARQGAGKSYDLWTDDLWREHHELTGETL